MDVCTTLVTWTWSPSEIWQVGAVHECPLLVAEAHELAADEETAERQHLLHLAAHRDRLADEGVSCSLLLLLEDGLVVVAAGGEPEPHQCRCDGGEGRSNDHRDCPGPLGRDAASFGLHTRDGTMVVVESVVPVEDRSGTVQFDEDADIEDALRPFVLEGAVQDRSGMESVSSAGSGGTTVPDVVAVEADDGGADPVRLRVRRGRDRPGRCAVHRLHRGRHGLHR